MSSHCRTTFLHVSGLIFLCGGFADHARSAELALPPFVDEQAVAVAYVDFADLELEASVKWAENLGLLEEYEVQDLRQLAKTFQSILEGLKSQGVTQIFWVFHTSNFSDGGPTWVIPLAKPENAQVIQLALMFGDPNSETYLQTNRPDWIPGTWDTVADKYLVGTYSLNQLERAKQPQPTPRQDFSTAFDALEKGNAGLVVAANDDSRRVLRELLLELPFPFEGINGTFLADRLVWTGIRLSLPPELELRLEFETRAPEAAKQLAATASNTLLYASSLAPLSNLFSTELVQEALDACQPQVEENRVRIVPVDNPADAKRLAKLLEPAIRSAREQAARSQRINNFKRIALGVLNFENANSHLPTQANYSPEGKPLLSWRVHVLPYLDGQLALYKEFHLDEPWDSEHNRKLIGRMPAIYADSAPEMRAANRAGKTNFLVPSGPSTLFDSQEPKVFGDVLDGTSNTILLVNVEPEAAVEWTKPSDWEVDFGNPWKALPREKGGGISAAYMDGSVRFLPGSLSAMQLSGLITPAGGEVVNIP